MDSQGTYFTRTRPIMLHGALLALLSGCQAAPLEEEAALGEAEQALPTGGFVVISADDADANGHCQGAACGAYAAFLNKAVTESRSGGTGILAVGVNQDAALSSLIDWNNRANGGPNATIIHASTAAEIAAANFASFAAVYIPSGSNHTTGGITPTQLAALNARKADLLTYVNQHGGSLVALTEAGSPGAWGWLPIALETEDARFSIASATPALVAIAPDGTDAKLNHHGHRSVFTGPSGFSGLDVLATHDSGGSLQGKPVILGGLVSLIPSEICNDHIDNDGDGYVDLADPDCQGHLPVCGDGTVDPGEQCDDGNKKNGDGCSAHCRTEAYVPACGNGTVDPGEQCDDGNKISGDGCSAYCQTEYVPVCGNGTVDPGEFCDDGNTMSGDGCSAYCRVEDYIPACGNGTVDPGEACDDGNKMNGDGCSAYCQIENKGPVVWCKDANVCNQPGMCSAVVYNLYAGSDPDGDPLTSTLSPPGPYSVGSHNVTVTLSDAQLYATCASVVNVADCEKPLITCPANQTVECTGYSQGYVKPLGAVAVDNCGVPLVTGPVAGSYPMGTTNVTYTAVDASGNAAACYSTVTVVDTSPPTITCPSYQTVACTGKSQAYVKPLDAIAVDSCSASTVTGPVAGSYPVGTTNVTYTAVDAAGNTSNCSSTITVTDSSPPVVSVGNTPELWPPNHTLRTVNLSDCNISAYSPCTGAAINVLKSGKITSVSVDEAVNVLGDGNTGPDVVFINGDSDTVLLRAERSGLGDGRVYKINFTVTDAAGNTQTGVCKVGVPHSQNGQKAVDSGPVYTVMPGR